MRRHGDPLAGGSERRRKGEDLRAYFDRHIERTEHGLIWTGPTRTGGVRKGRELRYGCVTVDGKRLMAHRLSYELNVGPIPSGDYVVDHRPECPKVCVTPAHLTLYSRGEHTAVGFARGEIKGWQS